MTTDLEHAIHSSLGDIIAAAPEPDDQPMRLVAVGSETRALRPYLAVAASLVVIAGVAGLVAIGTNDATPVSPAAAPTAPDDPSTAVATTTTVPGYTAPSAVVNPTPSCVTGAQALVPNVAGMPWVDAAAVLVTAGLEPNALPELDTPVETPDADHYVIIRQATAPGTITSCGTIVDITVAYRPGTLYVVQAGDTYESIAASQGITLEQLLNFNGLSVAELEAAGHSPSAPLALGQALRLSIDPATLGTPAGGTLNTPAGGADGAPQDAVPTTTTMP